MIITYVFNEKVGIKKLELGVGAAIPKGTVWIDLVEPTVEEEKLIEKALKIEAPTREEIDKIEVMSPFYKSGDAYYMTVTSICKQAKEVMESSPVIFILTKNCLVTVRYSRPRAFSFFSNRIMRYPDMCRSADAAFHGLVETLVHGLAEMLEITGNEIDQLLIDVFEKPSHGHNKKVLSGAKKKKVNFESKHHQEAPSLYYTNIIKLVGKTGNLISKIRESLVSINRMLIFFGQIEDGKFLSQKDFRNRFRNITREMHSITEYANFLAQRNSFLLDATLGMINVEQSMIIKVFTVAAAVFMPPTLIASVYGMNFHNIPELSLDYGYPMALVLIFLSALLPYYFFKRKGWL